MKLFLGSKPSNSPSPGAVAMSVGDDDDSVSISGRTRKLSAGDINSPSTLANSKVPLTVNHSDRRPKTMNRLQSDKESFKTIAASFQAHGELLGLVISVKIPYTRVGATKAGKIYTQYVLQIELPPPPTSSPNTPAKQWTIDRRYSQFCDLDKHLRQAIPKRDVGKLASLPPKRYLNSFEDSVILERKRGLAEYIQSALKAVLNNDEAAAILAVFLQMPGSPQLKSTDEELDVATSGANAFGIKTHNFLKESTAQFVTTADGEEAHHGFLWKRGGLYQQKPFKLSFCVLNFEEAVFRFYRTSRPQLLGAVQLKDQKEGFVQEIPGGEYGIPDSGFGLRLFTPERELIMYAETKEDRDSWIQAIGRCLPSRPQSTLQNRSASSRVLVREEKTLSRGDEEELDRKIPDKQDVTIQKLGGSSSFSQRRGTSTPSPVFPQKKPKGPVITTPQEKAERELEQIQSIREDWAIDWKDIEVMEKVGGGAFGTVFKGKCWGTMVAVKQLNTSGPITPELKLVMQKEVGVLSRLRHPNVVLFIGASYDEGVAAMVTEWCPRKSLFDLMQSVERASMDYEFNGKLMLKIALQIAQGMCYLHSRKEQIIHRDLKSLNVLMTDGFDAKVADFGLTVMREATVNTSNANATNRKERFESVRSQGSVFSNSGADFFGTEGTAQWMAPEVMEGARYNFKVDVYSYGILLTEILTRKMPFKDLYKGFDFVDAVLDRAERPTIPTWASLGGSIDVHDDESAVAPINPSHVVSSGENANPSALGDLVVWCLNRDPELRPNFRQVIQKLEAIIKAANDHDLLVKFDLPRLREMLDVGDIQDVIHSALEFSNLLRRTVSIHNDLPGPKEALVKFVSTSNIVSAVFSRIASGTASKVVENGGDYEQVAIPVETMLDLITCIRLLLNPSFGIDTFQIFQYMHFPKKEPLEAIIRIFLRLDLDQRGIETCGFLLNEFRSFSTKFSAVIDETMEVLLDEVLEGKRNPVMSFDKPMGLPSSALRRRTLIVSEKENLLWRCKTFNVLPNKYAKKGVVGGTRDDMRSLESEIRSIEAALMAKRKLLLEGTSKNVKSDVSKV